MDQEMDANLTITTAPTVQAATTHHSDYNIQFIPASIAAVSHSWIKHIPFTYAIQWWGIASNHIL